MKVLGISGDEQKAFWLVLAAIYHLGAAGATKGKIVNLKSFLFYQHCNTYRKIKVSLDLYVTQYVYQKENMTEIFFNIIFMWQIYLAASDRFL